MRQVVNAAVHKIRIEPGMPLHRVLRDEPGPSGNRCGCGMAQCAAFTVHIDGAPGRSCVLPDRTAEIFESEAHASRYARVRRQPCMPLCVATPGIGHHGHYRMVGHGQRVADRDLAASPECCKPGILTGELP